MDVRMIEDACRQLDVQFHGWVKQSGKVTLHLTKGTVEGFLYLPSNDFELLDVEKLTLRIRNLFISYPSN